MSVDGEMGIVNRGQDAPASIHLTIVLIDLRDYEKQWREEQGEGKGGYEGVRGKVNISKFGRIVVGLDELLW